MTAQFNLSEEPWIPVRTLDGAERRVSLAELFTEAHAFVDLAVESPAADAALRRILTVLTYRVALAVNDRNLAADTWNRNRVQALERGQFDPLRVADYFEKYQDRFDLFGPRPFLQEASLTVPLTASVNKIVARRSSGNNLSWFGGYFDTSTNPVEPGQAALYLLEVLYYGSGGKVAPRNGISTSGMGPLRGSVSYHPLGATLFETLLLGLVTPGAEMLCEDEDRDLEDLAVWELDSPQLPVGQRPITGPAAVLTRHLNHALLLVSENDGKVARAALTWGQQPGTLTARERDPYLGRRPGKDGATYTVLADATRSVWRDLDGLFLDATYQDLRPPVLQQLLSQRRQLGLHLDRFRVLALGLDQKTGTDASTCSVRSSTPPLLSSLRLTDPDAAVRGHILHKKAESAGWILNACLIRMWNNFERKDRVGAHTYPGTTSAMTKYWSAAEEIFWLELANPTSIASNLGPYLPLIRRIYDEHTADLQLRPRLAASISKNRP